MNELLLEYSIDRLVAGVDEVGRGPLVGDVVAAAVILDPNDPIAGLKDSKRLSERKREALETEIKNRAIAWSIAIATPQEIDQINILHATMLAMKRAVEKLAIEPEMVLVDGNRCPDLQIPYEAIVKGDTKIAAIAAASILAKVYRDRQMIDLDKAYPDYGFAKHKGYPTKDHLALIAKNGVIRSVYRRSFAPVKRLLGDQ